MERMYMCVILVKIILLACQVNAALHAPLTISGRHPTTNDPGDVSFVAKFGIGRHSKPFYFTIDTALQVTLHYCSSPITLANTSFTLNDTSTGGYILLRDIQISCIRTQPRIHLAALGPFESALPFQLTRAASLPTTFGYCLPRSKSEIGSLIFGAPPSNSTHIPVKFPSGMYTVHLSSIRFGRNNKLSGSRASFGMVTRYTSLPNATYMSLRDQFVAQAARMRLWRSASTFGELDVCYKMNMTRGWLGVFPGIEMVFSKKLAWTIPPENYLVPTRKDGIFCFGFTNGGVSASIGTFQQQDHVVEFDLAKNTLGITKYNCSFLFN